MQDSIAHAYVPAFEYLQNLQTRSVEKYNVFWKYRIYPHLSMTNNDCVNDLVNDKINKAVFNDFTIQ